MVARIKETKGYVDNYTIFYNETKRLLGLPKLDLPFSMPDVLADLDAKYLYTHYDYNSPVGDQLQLYHTLSSTNRFNNFYSGYSWEALRNHVKLYANDKMSAFRQPYYFNNNVSTVTENQSLAAANAFTDFIFENR